MGWERGKLFVQMMFVTHTFSIVVIFICSFKMGVVEGVLPLHTILMLRPLSSFYRFLRFVVDRLHIPSTTRRPRLSYAVSAGAPPLVSYQRHDEKA